MILDDERIFLGDLYHFELDHNGDMVVKANIFQQSSQQATV